jgi:hypothetical protein
VMLEAGLLSTPVPYDQIVATQFNHLWSTQQKAEAAGARIICRLGHERPPLRCSPSAQRKSFWSIGRLFRRHNAGGWIQTIPIAMTSRLGGTQRAVPPSPTNSKSDLLITTDYLAAKVQSGFAATATDNRLRAIKRSRRSRLRVALPGHSDSHQRWRFRRTPIATFRRIV